jgi:hypothetical protein
MTDWAALQHAYGEAGDVPGLLLAAEDSGTEFGPAWDEVWSRLCHQGTVYTASYAALPLLADIAQRHPPAGYVAALDLAAAIVASTDGPIDPAVVRREHANTITRLRALADRNLALADGDIEFVYGLQALMAFEDGGVWQRQLNHVADGELPAECPNCREFLILDLAGPEHTLANYTDKSVLPTPVRPADPPDDGSVAGRLLALSRGAGRSEVATLLRYALGSATCPNCGTAFGLADALTWPATNARICRIRVSHRQAHPRPRWALSGCFVGRVADTGPHFHGRLCPAESGRLRLPVGKSCGSTREHWSPRGTTKGPRPANMLVRGPFRCVAGAGFEPA